MEAELLCSALRSLFDGDSAALFSACVHAAKEGNSLGDHVELLRIHACMTNHKIPKKIKEEVLAHVPGMLSRVYYSSAMDDTELGSVALEEACQRVARVMRRHNISLDVPAWFKGGVHASEERHCEMEEQHNRVLRTTRG